MNRPIPLTSHTFANATAVISTVKVTVTRRVGSPLSESARFQATAPTT